MSLLLAFFARITHQLIDDHKHIPQLANTPRINDDSSGDEEDIVVAECCDLYGFPLGGPIRARRYYKVLAKNLDKMRKQKELLARLIADGLVASYVKGGKKGESARNELAGSIRDGIPPNHRRKLWPALCGVRGKMKVFLKAGIYGQLYTNHPTDTDAARDIRLDVPRTFPGSRNIAFIPKLERVLITYSMRNPQLGYCQAMNFLAGTLLVFLEEEEAFWMLVYIVEELLPNYYTKGMSGIVLDMQVFEHLVADELPALWRHFKKHGFDISLLCTKWFMSLFVGYLPNETVFIIWDSLMLDGVVVIFEVALGILRMFQPLLMLYTDSVEAMCLLNDKLHNLFDAEMLWSAVKSIKSGVIDSLRQEKRKKIEEDSIKNVFSSHIWRYESLTKFHKQELRCLWEEYVAMDPFLKYETTGMGYEVFSRVIGGTFSNWGVDSLVLRRLFRIFDRNGNGHVDFWELVGGLSVMCRGSFADKVSFVFQLYDIGDVGYMTKTNLKRLITSVYSPFYNETNFFSTAIELVNMLFRAADLDGDDVLSLDEFKEAMRLQSTVLREFSSMQRGKRIDLTKTFYYWVFDVDSPNFGKRVKLRILKDEFVSWTVKMKEETQIKITTEMLKTKHVAEPPPDAPTMSVVLRASPQLHSNMWVGAVGASI